MLIFLTVLTKKLVLFKDHLIAQIWFFYKKYVMICKVQKYIVLKNVVLPNITIDQKEH